jgi:transposase
MARYRDYNYHQHKLIPVSFSRQILHGTFEYTLSHVIDHELDLSVFAARYRNDETGAPAYDPALLLKIILYAYARGITSSREIERACSENVIFMALSADSRPHFSTLADFISRMREEITPLFREVLMICDELGLIGREMFAIDGCKLPSNASKEWSGTKEELTKKSEKMEQAVRYLVTKHQEEDAQDKPSQQRDQEQQQIETLRRQVKKIKEWLKDNDDKPGKSGQPIKSNLTDNDSAKMKTSHGVVQGYDGVASVDAKHQVIVHAEAFGEAQEHDLLKPMIEATRANFQAIGKDPDIFNEAAVTADSGFHTEQNVKALMEQKIDAYIADNQFRKRDPRFATAERHRARAKAERQREREEQAGKPTPYAPSDFIYDQASQSLTCPAGHQLYRNGSHCNFHGYEAIKFQGAQRDCLPCAQRAKCLRHPERTRTRQVAIFKGKAPGAKETYTEKMKKKIDTPQGRAQYSRRLGIVEPVFAHIRATLGLNRFSLRGRIKVNIQWKLYCIVHNLTKIHRYGFACG